MAARRSSGRSDRSLFATLCALLLLLLPPEPASAQAPTIGAVESVKSSAYGTAVGAERRDLSAEDPVFGDELVETVRGGALRLRFVDDTLFRLGSQSRAVLDKFVYDPERGTGEIALSLTKGLFRYVTGELKGADVTIRTPTLTMSVRGTTIIIFVLSDGTSFVWVLEGLVLVTSLADGSSMEVTSQTSPVQVLPGGSVLPYGDQIDPPGEELEPEEVLQALMGVSPASPGTSPYTDRIPRRRTRPEAASS